MRNIVKICFAVFLYAAITTPCIAQEVTAVPTTTTESSFHALDYVALFGYMGVVVVIGAGRSGDRQRLAVRSSPLIPSEVDSRELSSP
jgi:hypothetical protein